MLTQPSGFAISCSVTTTLPKAVTIDLPDRLDPWIPACGCGHLVATLPRGFPWPHPCSHLHSAIRDPGKELEDGLSPLAHRTEVCPFLPLWSQLLAASSWEEFLGKKQHHYSLLAGLAGGH